MREVTALYSTRTGTAPTPQQLACTRGTDDQSGRSLSSNDAAPRWIQC